MNRKSLLDNRRIFRKVLIRKETVSEKRLDNFFKSIKFKIEKQKIISPYITDFLVVERGLIIEIDGSIHNMNRIKEKDYRRDDYFMSMGLFVLHFNNYESPENIYKNIINFPVLHIYKIRNIKRCIAKVNGMANNIKFSKVMQDFSNYKDMANLWKRFKSGYLENNRSMYLPH